MTTAETLIKFRQRINKLHSQDYDNVPNWAVVELIRKAQLELIRRTIQGKNLTQDGDEETRVRVDDLQILLTAPKRLEVTPKGYYYLSQELPKDYLYFKTMIPYAKKGQCSNVRMRSFLEEEANAQLFLHDSLKKPSFEWRETFHTLAQNRIKVYRTEDFIVNYIELIYYRRPKEFDVNGYIHPDGKQSSDVPLEFKEDICEMIVDEAVSIAAADLELANRYQSSMQRIQNNN